MDLGHVAALAEYLVFCGGWTLNPVGAEEKWKVVSRVGLEESRDEIRTLVAGSEKTVFWWKAPAGSKSSQKFRGFSTAGKSNACRSH